MKWFLEKFLPSFPDGKYYFYSSRIPKYQYAGFCKWCEENNYRILSAKQIEIFLSYVDAWITAPFHNYRKLERDGLKILIDESQTTGFCTMTIERAD